MKKHLKRAVIPVVIIIILAAVISYIVPRKTPKGIFQTTGIIEATEVNLAPKNPYSQLSLSPPGSAEKNQ